jgi:hypothetical protein
MEGEMDPMEAAAAPDDDNFTPQAEEAEKQDDMEAGETKVADDDFKLPDFVGNGEAEAEESESEDKTFLLDGTNYAWCSSVEAEKIRWLKETATRGSQKEMAQPYVPAYKNICKLAHEPIWVWVFFFGLSYSCSYMKDQPEVKKNIYT